MGEVHAGSLGQHIHHRAIGLGEGELFDIHRISEEVAFGVGKADDDLARATCWGIATAAAAAAQGEEAGQEQAQGAEAPHRPEWWCDGS